MTSVKALSTPVPPGGTIGILGGGQLGRMLALAAARLGLKVHIYSDSAEAPAFQVCDRHTVAAYDDRKALADFAEACDAVTYEFENVPADAAAILSEHKPTHPNARALAIAQDRLDEKSFIAWPRPDDGALCRCAGRGGGARRLSPSWAARRRCSRRGGWGMTARARPSSRPPRAAAQAFERFARPCILEGFVDFAFEASVIGARGTNGSFAAYDPPENVHENHILKRSIVPGRLTADQTVAAKAIAKCIADALDYVGVLGVELFVAGDGKLLVNEIAPRVHNSGHWTLEACLVSQFEQHIRAVAGWPLGDASRHSDAVMENIIGQEAADWHCAIQTGRAAPLWQTRDPRGPQDGPRHQPIAASRAALNRRGYRRRTASPWCAPSHRP